MSTSAPATSTAAVGVHANRDDLEEPVTASEHDVDDSGFISFSESAPLRPLSFDIRTRQARPPGDSLALAEESRSSFLSLTPEPPLTEGDSSFLSFADTPPASSTPDPLSETLSVVQEEEEEEADIGGEAKAEEEVKETVAGGDRDEEIDLGDAILLESSRGETVVIEEEAGDVHVEGFYYDKELKRWVPAKKA